MIPAQNAWRRMFFIMARVNSAHLTASNAYQLLLANCAVIIIISLPIPAAQYAQITAVIAQYLKLIALVVSLSNT